MTPVHSTGSQSTFPGGRSASDSADAFQNEGGSQRNPSPSMAHSDLRHDTEQAVKSAKETLGSVRDMAGDVYTGARQSASNAANSLHDTVVQNPWASIGIAAGAGLLFGLLFSRLRS